MKRYIALIPLAWLAACTAPDLGPDLTSASQLLAQTSKELQPSLLPQAKKEQAAAELASMRGGNLAVGPEGDCDPAATHNEGRALSKCDLVTLSAPPDKPISATAVLGALDGLTAYYAALASARSSDAVASQVGSLIDALAANGSAANAPEALGQSAAEAAAQKDSVTTAAGFVVNIYRLNALHTVIAKADPVVGALTDRAVACLDLQPGGPFAAETRLNAARRALANSEEAKDLRGQVRATAELRAAWHPLLTVCLQGATFGAAEPCRDFWDEFSQQVQTDRLGTRVRSRKADERVDCS